MAKVRVIRKMAAKPCPMVFSIHIMQTTKTRMETRVLLMEREILNGQF